MRKKQARPAKRLIGAVFPEDDSTEGSRDLLFPTWHSPLSSPPPHNRTTSAAGPGNSTGISFCVSAMHGGHSAPPLKLSKHEPDNSDRCCVGECGRFFGSQLALQGSLNGQSPCISSSCPVPIISGATDHYRPLLSAFITNKNSTQSNSFDIPRVTVSRADESTEDSESPLKRLERCVRANSEAECSTFGLYRSTNPPVPTRFALTQSRTNANSMKLRFGYGKFTLKFVLSS